MEDEYYIVFDLETTGFDPTKNDILEIGCYIVRGEEVEEKHWVLDNKVEIPEKIVEITGITQEIIDEEGRDPIQCLQEFLPLFKGCSKNITHNGIKFDIPFLIGYASKVLWWKKENEKAVSDLIRSTAYDTAVNAKASKLGEQQAEDETFLDFADRIMSIFAKGVKYNLQLCVEESGLPAEKEFHRAMADVYYTHEIYKKAQKDNLPKNIH